MQWVLDSEQHPEEPSASDVATQSVTFTWEEAWVLENCTVLAVVSDADGYVINVEEIHLN